jgi:uncharacterized protein (UPF0333 family)
MLRAKRAQSTLEYVIVFTVIVAAVIVAANGVIRQRVQGMLTHAATQAEAAVNHINFE